ncbi:MAG TPA: hypothetical protein VD963_11305 [Phycisphaerales bacterium]|nr:hypothetical protein [Phycisphaerales bacterium]
MNTEPRQAPGCMAIGLGVCGGLVLFVFLFTVVPWLVFFGGVGVVATAYKRSLGSAPPLPPPATVSPDQIQDPALIARRRLIATHAAASSYMEKYGRVPLMKELRVWGISALPENPWKPSQDLLIEGTDLGSLCIVCFGPDGAPGGGDDLWFDGVAVSKESP